MSALLPRLPAAGVRMERTGGAWRLMQAALEISTSHLVAGAARRSPWIWTKGGRHLRRVFRSIHTNLSQPLRLMRWAGVLALLGGGAHAADWLNATAIEERLRWDIAAALPDALGQLEDTAPQITQLQSFHLGGEGRQELLLVRATLIFVEAETNQTGVVLIYTLDRRIGPRPLATPFFHGLDWARGQVPLADASEAAAAGANWIALAQREHP